MANDPLSRNPEQQLMRLADGNPGALTVLLELCTHPEGPGALDILEARGVTGPSVWVLYKDMNDCDLESTIAAIYSEDMKERLALLGY